MACFFVKKNPNSVLNPWLGVIPDPSSEELFGRISQMLRMGGAPRAFFDARSAFKHIEDHYPGDVGVMQVYELMDEYGEFKLRHEPWPEKK